MWLQALVAPDSAELGGKTMEEHHMGAALRGKMSLVEEHHLFCHRCRPAAQAEATVHLKPSRSHNRNPQGEVHQWLLLATSQPVPSPQLPRRPVAGICIRGFSAGSYAGLLLALLVHHLRFDMASNLIAMASNLVAMASNLPPTKEKTPKNTIWCALGAMWLQGPFPIPGSKPSTFQ